MECCLCKAPAVMTYGFTERDRDEFCKGLRTYYAYGRCTVLLAFCADHFEEATLTWPGLVGHPIQAVHRRAREAEAVKERVKERLRDPWTRRQVMRAWERHDREKKRDSARSPAAAASAKRAQAMIRAANARGSGARRRSRMLDEEHASMVLSFLRGLRSPR